MIFQGWTLAEQGRTEDGTAQIQGGLAQFRAMDQAQMERTHYLAMMTEALSNCPTYRASPRKIRMVACEF